MVKKVASFLDSYSLVLSRYNAKITRFSSEFYFYILKIYLINTALQSLKWKEKA
jgi:hypothetical protein